MIITPRAVEQISDRIERAYLRQHPEWKHMGLDPRLWIAAAAILMDAHRADPSVPVDPELFVACQTAGSVTSDPWSELTRASSRRRYLVRLRKIVRSLRCELREELQRINSAEKRGEELELILLSSSRRLSPLSRYLAAAVRNRLDLTDRLEAEARNQHESCPLYRQAAEGLIPAQDYPVMPLFLEGFRPTGPLQFSLN